MANPKKITKMAFRLPAGSSNEASIRSMAHDPDPDAVGRVGPHPSVHLILRHQARDVRWPCRLSMGCWIAKKPTRPQQIGLGSRRPVRFLSWHRANVG